MGKVIALALVFVICLSLCACSSANRGTAEANPQTTLAVETVKDIPETTEQIPEATENPNIIEFDEPVVVMENEHFRLELIRFWKKEDGFHTVNGSESWMFGEGSTCGADFQFYNKSETTYRISPDLYLGDVSVLDNGHFFDVPAPGKNALLQITIARWDGMNEVPIELEELYQLNGSIKLSRGVETTYSFSNPGGMVVEEN